MKKAAYFLLFVHFFIIISLNIIVNHINEWYWIPLIIFDIILLILAIRWVKKEVAKIKAQRDIEKITTPFTPGYKEYYYSKGVSVGLLVAYIFMPLCFTYAVTLPGQSPGYYVGMGIAAGMCYLFLFMIIFKWLLPAYRNQPAFSIDEHAIDLKNGYTPIKWNEIEKVTFRENIIGIKLHNLDDFIDRQPVKKNKKGKNMYDKFYGYHFGISLIIIRNDKTNIFETIEDYFLNGKDEF